MEQVTNLETQSTEPLEQPGIVGDLTKEAEEECIQSFGPVLFWSIYFS